MKLKQFKTQNKGMCSIEITPNGIAFAYAAEVNPSEITACDFYQFEEQNSANNFHGIRRQLKQIANIHNLKKIPCNWVLHPSFYHLTLIVTPNVPQAEYKKAVRWQIKDIINFSLEDTAIDIFYPDEPERTLKKIYVIAAQSSFLQEITDIIQEAELQPAAIDIPEFAIRNLITKINNAPNESIGLLDLTDNNCLLVIIKQNSVRFVRRIPIGLRHINSDNCDPLTTEIERSFSYCQSELKQELPTKLFVSPRTSLEEPLRKNFEESLNKEIYPLNLQQVTTFKTPITKQIESTCWVAVGGVLRDTNNINN